MAAGQSNHREQILTKLGCAIRYFRTRKSISQEALGDLCELDRTYIGGIERGERNPTILNVIIICKALEISPENLFKKMNEREK